MAQCWWFSNCPTECTNYDFFQPRHIVKSCLWQYFCKMSSKWRLQGCSVLSKTDEWEFGSVFSIMVVVHTVAVWKINLTNSQQKQTMLFYRKSCFTALVSEHFVPQMQCCTRWGTKQVYYTRNAIQNELFMGCKDQDVFVYKSCTMIKVFRSHNIALCKERCKKVINNLPL